MRFVVVAFSTVALAGCVSTSMNGYADRELPTHPIQHVIAYVAAPNALAPSLQSSIVQEAEKRGIVAEDALSIFPPTRKYTDAEIKSELAARGVDAILVVNVGDTGVIREYAGTFFQGQYSGSTSMDGTITRTGNTANASFSGTQSGSMTGTSMPMYRHSRQTTFNARLIEPSSSRTLYVGSGEVAASGRLFVGNGVSASNSISAIFDDLQKKGLLGGRS